MNPLIPIEDLYKIIPKPFIVHETHDFENVLARDWSKCDHRLYVIIDPGKTYFCMWIEKRKDDKVETIKKVLINFNSKKERWGMHDTFCLRLLSILDENLEYILNCHVVAIEGQVKDNPEMQKMMHYLICYFVRTLKNAKYAPLIMVLNNQVKTKVFGYKPLKGKGVTKAQKNSAVKKWAEKQGYHILYKRKDKETLEFIGKSIKASDPMDTVVMGEAIHHIVENGLDHKHLPVIIPKRYKKKKGGGTGGRGRGGWGRGRGRGRGTRRRGTRGK